MEHRIQNTLFIQLWEITMSTHMKVITNKQKQQNHHHHNVPNYTVSINIKIDVHARSMHEMLWYSEGNIFLHHSSNHTTSKKKESKKEKWKMGTEMVISCTRSNKFLSFPVLLSISAAPWQWECNYNVYDYNWIKITRILNCQLYSMQCH